MVDGALDTIDPDDVLQRLETSKRRQFSVPYDAYNRSVVNASNKDMKALHM